MSRWYSHAAGPTARALAPWFVAALALALAGCEGIIAYEGDACRGYPEVLNPIPDVVLVAEAELYVRDLERRPFVFDHTYGDHLYYETGTSNRRVARAYVDRGVLTVEALRPGIARIRVDAFDSCDAYATTTFVVDVLPYRAHP